MWPFNCKETLRKKLINKSFSKHMDGRLLSLFNEKPDALNMIMKQINFVMILASQSSRPDQIIGEIISLVQKYTGMVDSITCIFITIYFGVPLDQSNQKELRIAFLAELSEKFGSSLAILHGECECPVGNLGNDKRMAYTAFLPEYKSKLCKLSSLEFGQILED
jgi:hypothetical protein